MTGDDRGRVGSGRAGPDKDLRPDPYALLIEISKKLRILITYPVDADDGPLRGMGQGD